MKTQFILASLLVVVAALSASAADTGQIAAAEKDDLISVSVDKGVRLTYRSTENPYKAYVKTLCAPSGVNILRDSPHDHIHHHSLMFAVAADGVDFWAEFPNKKPGTQHSKLVALRESMALGDWTAVTIDATLEWKDVEEKQIVDEQRRISTYVGEGLKPTLLDWQTTLSPAKGKTSVKLTGSHYFGLGMRFVESMDKGGRFFNASKTEGPIVRGTERLTPTKWMAYTAKVDGKPVTVAMFDHPTNPRHPNKMFTMTAPFAYLSATLNLWKEPLTIEAGKPLKLRYGVALWDGEVSAEEVEKVYGKWKALK